MARLSPLPAERAVQMYILVAMGWLFVSIAIVVPTVYAGADPSEELGGTGIRGALGVVMALIALALPVIVAEHRDDLPRVYGLRSRFVLASAVTAFVCVAGAVWFWWTALPGVVLALVALGLTLTRPAAGPDAEQRLDYYEPDAWATRSGREHLMTRRPVLFWFLIFTGALVAVVVLVAGLLLFAS